MRGTKQSLRMKQNYNGKILSEEELQLLQNNRAFLYGDGFFESMRWQNNQINFFNDHLERVKKACSLLKLKSPFPIESLQEKVKALANANQIKESARVRLIMFRNSNGTYLPDENNTGYTIIIQPLLKSNYILNDKGLQLDFYRDQTKSSSSISTIKSLNCNVSVLGSIYAQENKLDDVILFNNHNKIIEATGSSLFIVKNNQVITPPLSDGCADGVMRKQIFICARQLNIEAIEQSLSAEDILSADEVFITNVVRGIQWVEWIQEKRFERKVITLLFNALNVQLTAVA